MDVDIKRQLRKAVDPRYAAYKVFTLLFLISAVTAIIALRHNNETMINLRNRVYAADRSGSNVNAALNNLRNYVYAHMNTDLSSGGNTIKPPIQLKYTYDRLLSAAQASANNTGLYTQAEDYCQAQIPASVSISGRGRIDCVQGYILSHGGKQPAAIPPQLYEFDFVSPSWSPDVAGWSLLAAILLAAASIVSFIAHRWRTTMGIQKPRLTSGGV